MVVVVVVVIVVVRPSIAEATVVVYTLLVIGLTVDYF